MTSPEHSSRHSVAVTGWSAMTDAGFLTDELWQLLLRDEPRKCPAHRSSAALAEEIGLTPADASILARHQLLALAVLEQAWRHAALPEERNRLRGGRKAVRRPRFGCVAGSSLAGLTAMLQETAESKPAAYSLSRWRGNSISAPAALRFGLGGADFSLSAASATGAQTLFLAGSLVAAGVLDVVAVVAAEPALAPLLSAAARRNGSVTVDASARPLSRGRSGMDPAEGAAAVVLESVSHAEARGALVRARWLGGFCGNEATHLVAAAEDGAELRGQLEQARRLVHGRGGNVDWISLHATGTRQFDSIEIGAVRSVFGEELPWLTAMKRVLGHALGASGLIEAALVLEGLSRGEVPSWPGDVDPDLGLIGPSGDALSICPKTALLIGQGMGGTVVTNVLASAHA